MGLDLGIVRRRKDSAYSICAWEDVCWWRNCWAARDIILDSIENYDKEECEADLTLGALQIILSNLVKEVCSYNVTVISDDILKMYQCISDIAKIIHDEQENQEWNEPEYNYKLIDSY